MRRETSTCSWPIGPGQTLTFTIYDYDATQWKTVGGLYIFARVDGDRWDPLYVGKTENFRTRIPSHERWDEARRLGATHVHALVVPLEAHRTRLEAALICHLKPPMNQQPK
jgi:predicted GIY-YIG superfamily endonuclease